MKRGPQVCLYHLEFFRILSWQISCSRFPAETDGQAEKDDYCTGYCDYLDMRDRFVDTTRNLHNRRPMACLSQTQRHNCY